MQFEVKALRGSGSVTSFALDAADANDAAVQARSQGYTVITVKAKEVFPTLLRGRRGKFPLVLFSQELVALLEAGLTLVEALETLNEKEQRPDVKKTLSQIVAFLYEGQPLSQAMQQFPEKFPPLYVATVRASEKTGALAEVLTRYVIYQSQMDNVKQRVVSASIYPMMLAGVGSLVLIFLMLYVVPRFSRVYADIGSNLPFMSQLLMNWGQMIEAHGPIIFTGIIGGFAGLAFLASRPESKRWLEQKLWQLPAIGPRLHLYQLTRFYRSLGMLLRGGMPIVASLQMVSDLLHATMRGQLTSASESIRDGQSISVSMEKYGLTTPVALRMLRVGERTGKMGEMMERIAAFYEEETARWVDRFTKLFEPLLMVFIGLAIGVIVVLMYFPIFEVAESIQ